MPREDFEKIKVEKQLQTGKNQKHAKVIGGLKFTKKTLVNEDRPYVWRRRTIYRFLRHLRVFKR